METQEFIDQSHLEAPTLNAWIDAEWLLPVASRQKLLLFSSSIILGIAALVAIGSFGDNLNRAIAEQAKSLLGADLALHSSDPFTPDDDQLFQKLGGEQSREISLTTMIYFPRNKKSDQRQEEHHADQPAP